MLVVTLEDFVGSIEVTVFPDTLEQMQPLLKLDSIVFIQGELDTRREQPSVRINGIIPVSEARRRLARQIVVRLRSLPATLDLLPSIRQVCRAHRGRCALHFDVAMEQGDRAVIQSQDGAGVDPSDELMAHLADLVGAEQVRCG